MIPCYGVLICSHLMMGLQILKGAAEAYGLDVVIFRIGQLAGSRHNGAWNRCVCLKKCFFESIAHTDWVFVSSDWAPTIVKSGLAMGVLPDIKAVAAWIPVDAAAEAIAEMTLLSSQRAPSSPPQYRHIVHPRAVSWLDIWKRVAAHLEQLYSKPVNLVPYDDWRDALRQAAAAPSDNDGFEAATQANPAIKLLATTFDDRSSAGFEELAGGEGAEAVDSLGIRRLKTRLSEGESNALSHVSPLGAADVEAWIREWVGEGFLPPRASGANGTTKSV
jgi:hypothetical protein